MNPFSRLFFSFLTVIGFDQTKVKNKVKFLVVDDYTSIAIWDELILKGIPRLKSKPQGWNAQGGDLPQGDWTLGYGMHPMSTVEAYSNFGVRKPLYEELPVVFCVKEDGTVEERRNVGVDEVVGFIAARI